MVRKILAAAWLSTSACACIAGHDAAPAASRCGFESVAIPGFVAADTGAATPGRSRPVDGGIELCSATAGFGSTSDEHRHAARSAVADFVLVAAIDPQTVGEASVGFARNSQDDRGPRVRASLRRTGDGGATLRVGVRTDANASESVLVDQPIDRVDHVVRLSREDAVISVALDDPEAPDGFVTIATVPTLGTPLEGAGDVFLAQASGTVGAVARAIFRRVSLTADPSVADPECADAVEADPGATTTIVGRALQHVDRVFVDGQTAAVQASASRVVFEMPAFESNALRSIEVESRGRRFALRSPVLVHGSSTAPPPADPELDEIVDAAGAVVRALSAGDDAFLVVSGLARIDGLRVFLGDVEAELLGDSTKTKLHVRVPRIRYDHLGCPTIFVPSARSGSPSSVVFGDAFGVDPSQHAELCPQLDSDESATAPPSRLVATTVLDDTLLGPDTPLRVRALWSESSDGRATRGSRWIELEVLPPIVRPGEDRRAATLAKIVRTVNEHLGGSDEGCGCDVLAQSDADAGTLSFAPCGMSPGPLPTIPPWPTSLVPNVPVWSRLDITASVGIPPEPVDCGTVARDEDPRAWGWCQFRAVVSELGVGPLAGYPRFESFANVATVLEDHSALNLEAQGIVRPEDRHAIEETTVMEPGMAERFVELGYADPRGYAARARYCTAHEFEQTWMPRFRTGDRLLKLMWVDAERLGAGMDPARLYSYQPAVGPRQYLVGMHIGVARFLESTDYFDWLTFWVPPVGDAPPRYNTLCPTGTNADEPLDFHSSAWGDFVMCVETGGPPCGNPWAVSSECNLDGAVGCASCHTGQGRFPFDDDGTSRELVVAWLPGVRTQIEGFAEALLEIDEGADYEDYVDCSRSNPQQPSDPFLE